ncbi:hypothetical protein E1301_Tti009143 [Triplophysa tibetana]|uniref:BTB domain-containing protein n=1 Tax=Triplophysa tibetana TaxID=1572043 RepID=A0A5A9PM70_9TELE|nr:hypothetical protein E1301_Tti009143 [Triplophysa tibetana]
MWKYKQPDFALFLLGELQKQQQGSIFCDTLLQTGGVCVPAHSCVLAALSPIFSRILSTSPAPPEGKNRLLSLEAVESHALLKLVGFLYTGEMEIESWSEHEDVMAAAHKLGLKNLIEKKRVWVERGVEDVGRCWKEAAVQTDESVKAKESVSVPLPSGRQRSTFYNANYCDPPGTSMLEADLSFDESSSSRGFNWIRDVTVPPLADVTEASNQCKTNAKNRWKMRDGQTQNLTWQQSQVKLLNVERAKVNQPEVMERSRNVSGKDFRKLLEAVSLPKIATSEQKLDKLKVKIKLRRRGACWESNLIVSVQGESESVEVKECGPPTPTCPSSVLPAQSLGTLTPPTDLPISPSDCSSHVSSAKPCPQTPNRSSMPSALDLPALSSSPPQADESEEQIAMLLEDMFMMGLNILPLMPLEKNLEEHELNQLDPLQEDKGAAEPSVQGSCPYVRGCLEEVRESGFTETLTPIRSPQQSYEELENSGFHKQLRPETVHHSAQLAGEELHASLSNMNKDTSLYTMEMDSAAPLVEDQLLTTKKTAGPHGPAFETGDMSDFNMSSIPEDGMIFRLRKCLSPIETDEKDVPTNQPSEPSQEKLSETHEKDPKAKLNPLLLSESSSKLDFTLGSVIDSSCPHPCLDPNGSQDQSKPEKQKLKTHRDKKTENGSSVDQANIIGELPKQRMTRRRLASQRLKEFQESRTQTRLSKIKSEDNFKEPRCGNVQLKTPNSCRNGTQMSTPLNANRKIVAGGKRKQENCQPRTKKMCLDTASKQHEHEGDLPKVQVTAGPVKRGRGRPPKSQKHAEKVEQKCDNAKKLRQDVLEQDDKKEPNTREGDSTKMRESDVNGNFVQTKQNVHVKYSGGAKRSSIIDKIFHQPGNARRCSFGRQLTANQQDKTCSPQRLQGAVEKSGECGNLVNGSEYVSKSVCGENEAVMSAVEIKDAMDNQVRLQMSHSSTSHIVLRTVEKGGRPAVEENSGREATVLQSDFPNVTEISVAPSTSENLTKDVTDVDHTMSPTETGRSDNNNPEVMERINITRIMPERHTSVGINPEAENFENKKKEAAVSNKQEFLENNEEEDLEGRKVDQLTKETFENKETEIQMTNDEAVQEIAQCASDVGNNKSFDIDLDGGRCSSDTLLEEDKLMTGHTAGGRMTDDSSNAAMTLRGTQVIVKYGPTVQTGEVSNQSIVNEDRSTLQIAVSSSDEEVIEVDVLEHSLLSNSPLLLLAAVQTISLPIEDLQDQDVEMDVTEEEEVDVTGEDTD